VEVVVEVVVVVVAVVVVVVVEEVGVEVACNSTLDCRLVHRMENTLLRNSFVVYFQEPLELKIFLHMSTHKAKTFPFSIHHNQRCAFQDPFLPTVMKVRSLVFCLVRSKEMWLGIHRLELLFRS